jgi:hypothetical protein
MGTRHLYWILTGPSFAMYKLRKVTGKKKRINIFKAAKWSEEEVHHRIQTTEEKD